MLYLYENKNINLVCASREFSVGAVASVEQVTELASGSFSSLDLDLPSSSSTSPSSPLTSGPSSSLLKHCNQKLNGSDMPLNQCKKRLSFQKVPSIMPKVSNQLQCWIIVGIVLLATVRWKQQEHSSHHCCGRCTIARKRKAAGFQNTRTGF